MLEQEIVGDLRQIEPVEWDAALLRGVEPGDDAQQSRLARADPPDHADAFARIDPQPLDLEPFLRAGIDERHAIEPDLALQAFGPEVGGFRGMILRQPENAVELAQRRARIAPLDDEKMGRASCRERVCQYV